MFLNALMLAGLGGAAVPLLLHLLSRARYRSVEWGAMMFLGGGEARQQQSTRARQWILLALRMAMVGLLAVALARPVVQGRWGGLASGGRVTAAIVLDCSASMSCQESGHTRLELAREAALQILANLRKGDQVALVVLGDSSADGPRGGGGRGGGVSLLQPTSDLQAVASRLNDLKPLYGEADLAEGLARAADLLERYERYNRELYVICDQQAANWSRLGQEEFRRAWHQRASLWDGPLRFAVIPVGSATMDNLAVESVQLLDAPAIKGRSGEVEVRLRNYGSVPRTGVPLSLRLGERELAKGEVHLAAGASGFSRFPVRFDDASSGSQVLSASIQSTGLTWDDIAQSAIDVTDPVKVLILSGDERPGAAGFRSESSFLRLALAPYQASGRPGADPAVVTVLPVEKWARPGSPELRDFQVVVLANVPQLSAAQVRAVEQFVYDGGGLLVAPAGLSRAESYNTAIYRGGVGVLPAGLAAPTAADGSAATSLLGLDLNHAIFRFVKGRTDPVPSVTVGRYFPVTGRAADARVLGSYASGDPFLLESTAGRGCVLLLTTSIDGDWNTLPLSSFYLPFAQSAVRYLAAGTLTERNLRPGEPILAAMGDLSPDAKPTLTLPDGSTMELAVGKELRYAGTQQPGRYVLRGKSASGGERVLHFVVQPSPVESDPTSLTPGQWQELAQALAFERIDPDSRSLGASVGVQRQGRELWGMLLGAVLALGLAELALTRLWTREGR